MEPLSFDPSFVSTESQNRKQAFKVLLLKVSDKLEKKDMEKVGFCMEMPNLESSYTSLQLLEHLWRKGKFSPLTCSRLEDLLKEIGRHDLAAEVGRYLERYPDKR